MIHVDRSETVAILRMEHGKANALDTQLLQDLSQGLDEAVASGAGAVVLTGTGAIFSAGVDLFKVVQLGRDYLNGFLPALSELLLKLFSFDRPVVAAVNGHAIAGGGVITCACDYRLMARGTGRIGVPELLVGVPFPLLALEILRFAVPAHQVQTLVYTGLTCLPEDAFARGLIDELSESDVLLEHATAVAARLAAIAPRAFALTKRSLRQATLDRIRAGESAVDVEVRELWAADDTRRSIEAYLQKTVGRGR